VLSDSVYLEKSVHEAAIGPTEPSSDGKYDAMSACGVNAKLGLIPLASPIANGPPISAFAAIAESAVCKPWVNKMDHTTVPTPGLFITGICAIAVYAVFLVFGWLCAGFTRDQDGQNF
jgi:hypothetical protein